MKKILILGGGGFIGGHLAKKFKNEGHWVRIVDIKNHEYFNHDEICDEFILGDLTNPMLVSKVMFGPNQTSLLDSLNSFDEVYQLAADMGGAGYIFTGENDANVMHNSALINLNVAKEAVEKNVKKIFYSSSACMYPEHNQLDPNNPNCEESSAYPANPDSEYGWEKLFSERLYLAFMRNYGLNVRIARFHNIFGPYGTWKGGKEKAPAAMCRKAAETKEGDEIEVWGDGTQTRSFLYIDECVEAVIRLMDSDFVGPVNIGSEEKISINELAELAIKLSNKNISIKNIYGDEFIQKYGHKCPTGVKGRNSDNKLYRENIGWEVNKPLIYGLTETYKWIEEQVKFSNKLIFAHNSHNRPRTLENTIKLEEKFFPNSKFYVCVTENGKIPIDFFNKKIKTLKTDSIGWQLGCVNSFYSLVSKICEENDEGIIVFSHDDVYLKDIQKVKENISNMIENDISYIVRRPETFFGENYYMMEVVYLNISKIKNNFLPYKSKLIDNEGLINKDANNTISAEAWLYNKLKGVENGMVIDYKHVDNTIELINKNLVQNMGYFHINLGVNGWKE